MAEAKFYVYVHRREDTGAVFYVGKGQGQRAYCRTQRGRYWERVAGKYGLLVEIVGSFVSELDAFKHERALIAVLRAAGVKLVNLTDGGDGASGAKRSEETLRRMSEAGKGKHSQRRSQETRDKMRASAIGRRMSPEAIAKTAAFHRGRKRSPETLAKMSAALKGKTGRKLSPEEIENLRAIRTGRKHSDEARAKIAAKARGRKLGPQSPEHRAKIAQKRREYWERWRAERAALT